MAQRKRRGQGREMVNRLFNEFIAPGNLLYTRGSYYQELIAEGMPKHDFGADYLAFSPPALTPSEVQDIRDYWGWASGIPEGWWNRTGEVPVLPLEYMDKPKEERECLVG